MSDSMQRGLSDKQIAIIQNSQKLMDILRRDDIFFGIRNGYFNLYYHGVSAGKLSFLSKGTLKIETHCKYLGEDTEGYKTVPLDIYLDQFDKILAYIQTHQQSGKGWDEKIAQQNFMMATNRNPNSVWYCVDMEYVQQRQISNEPCYGRFDIVALSRSPNSSGLHDAALIELKIGSKGYKSEFPKEEDLWLREQIEKGAFRIDQYHGSLGSGVVGHLADFYRFEKTTQFNKLKEEICQTLSNKKKLGIPVACAEIQPCDIVGRPNFYFLTLCSNPVSCKKSMCRYLGVDGHKNIAKYNAHKIFGQTFLDCENYHFLFAPMEFCNKPPINILNDASIAKLE